MIYGHIVPYATFRAAWRVDCRADASTSSRSAGAGREVDEAAVRRGMPGQGNRNCGKKHVARAVQVLGVRELAT